MTHPNETKPLPRILVVIADYYKHIAELQINAVNLTLENKAIYEFVHVPGALEIPVVIAAAEKLKPFDGYVALGCVIRGETTHYDTVCNESSRALMDLAIQKNIPIGNGIITVENEQQALARADYYSLNKAGGAAFACMQLITIFKNLKV